MIDVVVLNYNDYQTTAQFVERIKEYEIINKIVVVDNCSTDESVEQLSTKCDEKVILLVTDKNNGYGYGNNVGIKYLKKTVNSQFILVSNPDVIVEEQTLEKLETFLKENDEYVIVAPQMYDKNGLKQENSAQKTLNFWESVFNMSVLFSTIIKPHYYSDLLDSNEIMKQVDMVSGAMFLLDADKFLSFGGFDERLFLFEEEQTVGIKAKKQGYKVALLLKESFIHIHSVSINKQYKSIFKKRRLLNKSKVIVINNYYNPSFVQSLIMYVMMVISFLEDVVLSLFLRNK